MVRHAALYMLLAVPGVRVPTDDGRLAAWVAWFNMLQPLYSHSIVRPCHLLNPDGRDYMCCVWRFEWGLIYILQAP
jgi:hypothetical protein